MTLKLTQASASILHCRRAAAAGDGVRVPADPARGAPGGAAGDKFHCTTLQTFLIHLQTRCCHWNGVRIRVDPTGSAAGASRLRTVSLKAPRLPVFADALLPLEMVYAYEPIPPEAPPAPADLEAEAGAASDAASMSPNGGAAGSDSDMDYSAVDGCGSCANRKLRLRVYRKPLVSCRSSPCGTCVGAVRLCGSWRDSVLLAAFYLEVCTP